MSREKQFRSGDMLICFTIRTIYISYILRRDTDDSFDSTYK